MNFVSVFVLILICSCPFARGMKYGQYKKYKDIIAIRDFVPVENDYHCKLENHSDSTLLKNAEHSVIELLCGNEQKSIQMHNTSINNLKARIDSKKNAKGHIDTVIVNKLINVFTNQIEKNNNSTRVLYILLKYRSELYKLKAEMLMSIPNYIINKDYLESMVNYAWDVKNQKNKIEAQRILENIWIEWRTFYTHIDFQLIEENEKWDLIMARMNIEDVLWVRTMLYENGDSAGHIAYKDYLEYLRDEYGNQSSQYKSVLQDYYRFIDNHKKYIEFAEENRKKSTNYYRDIAKEYEALGDYKLQAHYLKKYIKNVLLTDEIYKKTDEIITSVELINNIYHQQEMEDSIYTFYKSDLLPAFSLLNRNYKIQFLFASLFKLRDCISNIEFEKIFDNFVNENFGDLTQYEQYLYKISKIEIISRIPDFHSYALEQIENTLDNCENSVFQVKLMCMKFKVLYSDMKNIKSVIAYGHSLYDEFEKTKWYKNYLEYIDFISNYLCCLYIDRDYKSYVTKSKAFLQQYEGKEGWVEDKITQIWDSQDLLHFSRLSYYGLIDFAKISIKNKLLKVYSGNGGNEEESAQIAFDIIKDKKKHFDQLVENYNVSNKDVNEIISISTTFAHEFKTDSLNIYAYDCALAAKGAHLQSYNSIKSLIYESDHQTAISRFNNLLEITKQIAYTKEHIADSLRLLRNKQEKELAKMSRLFGEFHKFSSSTWKNVKNALSKEDLCIEFTLTEQRDTIKYFACIIAPSLPKPIVVYLCDEQDIPLYMSNPDSVLINNIWKPISYYLRGVKNIYFSPIGNLNCYAIESVTNWGEKKGVISDYYNIYRVSSTRQLIHMQKKIGDGMVIYGGLNYNTPIDSIESNSFLYPDVREICTNRKMDGTRKAVQGLPYLPGTKEEAYNIYNTIKDKLQPSNIFWGNTGTEASLKSFSGKNKRVIHIATHGYYEDYSSIDKELSNEKSLSKQIVEESVLKKSGLCFAGANNTLLGFRMPLGVEDGVLTSLEISLLDFSGLELVSLSACETALGHISSEGVFGLQRGFKLAGANSILMSLWKVDDAATCKLMTEFYSNWIAKKMTKHDALEAAKKIVRETPGWEDPKYWAAFILLDGLD